MDWSTFWTAIGGALGGGAVVCLAAIWIIKKWLGRHIEESVSHQYNTKLESHKAELQQETTAAIRKMEADYQDAVDQQAADKELFTRLLRTLPANGSIHFLRENNFAGFSFSWQRLSQLNDFVHEWDNVDHEFLDADLEAQRQALLDAANRFLAYLGSNTWPLASGDRSSVPQEWEDSEPQRFRETVGRIHELAEGVVSCHTDLVRNGRSKLKMAAPDESATGVIQSKDSSEGDEHAADG